MTHTPGPWVAFENGVDNDIIYIVSDDDPICSIFKIANEKSEANARLIAAAPEMLKALKAVEWQVRPGGAEYCPWCNGMYPNHRDNCQRQAAIAKAEAQP